MNPDFNVSTHNYYEFLEADTFDVNEADVNDLDVIDIDVDGIADLDRVNIDTTEEEHISKL
jgi:hypothetical protein